MKRKKKDDSAENWSYKNDYPKKHSRLLTSMAIVLRLRG